MNQRISGIIANIVSETKLWSDDYNQIEGSKNAMIWKKVMKNGCLVLMIVVLIYPIKLPAGTIR